MQSSELTPNNVNHSLSLLKDHIDLVSLEFRIEKQEGWRRLMALGVGAILIFSSFLALQLPIYGWFANRGWGFEAIGLMMGTFYFLSGLLVLVIFTKRNKQLGVPFSGSLKELNRSFNWIQKHFS